MRSNKAVHMSMTFVHRKFPTLHSKQNCLIVFSDGSTQQTMAKAPARAMSRNHVHVLGAPKGRDASALFNFRIETPTPRPAQILNTAASKASHWPLPPIRTAAGRPPSRQAAPNRGIRPRNSARSRKDKKAPAGGRSPARSPYQLLGQSLGFSEEPIQGAKIQSPPRICTLIIFLIS